MLLSKFLYLSSGLVSGTYFGNALYKWTNISTVIADESKELKDSFVCQFGIPRDGAYNNFGGYSSFFDFEHRIPMYVYERITKAKLEQPENPQENKFSKEKDLEYQLNLNIPEVFHVDSSKDYFDQVQQPVQESLRKVPNQGSKESEQKPFSKNTDHTLKLHLNIPEVLEVFHIPTSKNYFELLQQPSRKRPSFEPVQQSAQESSSKRRFKVLKESEPTSNKPDDWDKKFDSRHPNLIDRGHLAAKGNRHEHMNNFMNIAPQYHNVNQGIWNSLEKYGRNLAKSGEVVDIFTGPLFLPENFDQPKTDKTVQPDKTDEQLGACGGQNPNEDTPLEEESFIKYELIGPKDQKRRIAVPPQYFKCFRVKNELRCHIIKNTKYNVDIDPLENTTIPLSGITIVKKETSSS